MGVVAKELSSVLKAAADYRTKQWYLVYLSAAYTGTLATTNVGLLGPIQNKPYTGYGIDIPSCGEVGKVITGEAITFDTYLTGDASTGVAVAAVDGDPVFGRALASAASGYPVEYLHMCVHASDLSDGAANNA